MKHLSLFSGIGGFDLAAEWMGWTNVAQVESDKYCLSVLEKNFPKTKRYGDIKEFTQADYVGRVDIITGGFPCQPFSQAGARRGRDDNRYLWPEMLRVIQKFKPTFVLAENVRGLLNIEGGVAFEQVCLDLEANGYEVQPFIIPACAVNAPHRRDRVWFIGYSNQNQLDNQKSRSFAEKSGQETSDRPHDNSTWESRGADKLLSKNGQFDGYEENVTYSSGTGLERCGRETAGHCGQPSGERSGQGPDWTEDWIKVATKFCSMDDGLPVELGELKLSKSRHKAEQIKGYGNAIVPQVAYEIFKSLINAIDHDKNEGGNKSYL